MVPRRPWPRICAAFWRGNPFWRWCRRKPVVAGLSAALVLVLVGSFAGVTLLWLHAEEQRVQAVKAQNRAQDLTVEAKRQEKNALAAAEKAKIEANKALRTVQVLVETFQAPDPLGL